MSCECDFEAPDFYDLSKKKARKEHKCSECNSTIKIGEIYEYVSGKWEGDISIYKTCPDCLNIIEQLEEKDCFCRMHCGLWENIYEHMEEATNFEKGEKFAIYRLIVNHRQNKKKIA